MEKIVLIELLPTGIKMTTEQPMGGAFHKKIDEISDTVRFDEDIYSEQQISDEKMLRCLYLLESYKNLANAKGVVKIYAYASSVFQELKSPKRFFDEIFKKTNIYFNMFSPEEEMRLIYNGIVGTVDTAKGVIVHVNPHNIYVMNFAKRSLMASYILPFGSNNLAHKFGCDEKQDANQVAKEMIEFVCEEIASKNMQWEELEDVKFVGTGDLMKTIAKLVRKINHYPLDAENNFYLTARDIDKAHKLLVEQGFNKNKCLANISSERLDNLIAGCSILKAFCTQRPEITQFNIASRCITESIISHKIIRENSCEGTPNDPLEMSLKNIKYYYPVDESNSDNVYFLTFELFQQMSIVHKLPRKYIKALKVATSLYDCGKRINFENNSKYSRDVILNSGVLGIGQRDLIVAAFGSQMQNLDNFVLADWVKYSEIVDEEDLIAARKIGTLIALASALDASKQNKIKEISCDLLGDIVIIKAKTDVDASFEIAEASKINKAFKKVFNKTYQIM